VLLTGSVDAALKKLRRIKFRLQLPAIRKETLARIGKEAGQCLLQAPIPSGAPERARRCAGRRNYSKLYRHISACICIHVRITHEAVGMGKERSRAFPIRPRGDGSATGGSPVRAEQMATGTVIVYDEEAPAAAVALYARVSGHEQKDQLTAQLGRLFGRLSEYASREKLIVSHSVAEIGSGVNGHRPKPKTHEVAEKQGRPGSRRRASGPSLSVSALKMLNARRQSRPCETSSDLIRQNPLTRNKTRI
jgi:hypothetical protein